MNGIPAVLIRNITNYFITKLKLYTGENEGMQYTVLEILVKTSSIPFYTDVGRLSGRRTRVVL